MAVHQLSLFTIAIFYRTWGGVVYCIEEITYWSGHTEILNVRAI